MKEVAGREPDGVVIIHHPPDGGESYGVGPFPPLEELVELLLGESGCGCRREALYIGFPNGIRMAIGVDTEAIEAAVAHLMGNDGPVH